MKCLILSCSPRKKGVTSTLLTAMEAEASRRYETTRADVNSLDIKPCIGCEKCRPDKRCILPEDDAHRAAELIRGADILVIGSPTYWGNITAPLKALFDRNVPLIEYIDGWTLKPMLKGKRAILVVSSDAPFPFSLLSSQAGGTIRALKTILKAGGVSIKGILSVSGAETFEKRKERLIRRAVAMLPAK
ncbi:MAG: hypothetical protein A2Y33_12780 [Spirochaetes bacterium GWF1_51_8]|nr:MAG: hypothetical protein A2Y33_12780 [Spirochaetes bacterium GWF1_51_8]